MTRLLFIDTETTGLPQRGLSATDPRQARLVQFAAVIHDSYGRERHTVSMLVNPGVQIPEGATKVHGIKNEDVELFGVPEVAALGVYLRLVSMCDVLSGYNVAFDCEILRLAHERARIRTPWPTANVRDVCSACTPIVNMPPTERMIEAGFGDKPKTPKLTEAHEFFFGRPVPGAHDALVDVRAAASVYYALVERGAWKEAA